MKAYHWRHLCADADSIGYAHLRHPWIVGDRVFATDGCALYAAPARLHLNVPDRDPDDGDPPDAASLLLPHNTPAGPVFEADLWRLIRWAGPLRALDVLCPECSGTGTIGAVRHHADGRDDDDWDLVGPEDERPDVAVWGDCNACGGTGHNESQIVCVSLVGVLLDAYRLARALWALTRLDGVGGAPRPVRVAGVAYDEVSREGGTVRLDYGDSTAILRGLCRGNAVRTWMAERRTP